MESLRHIALYFCLFLVSLMYGGATSNCLPSQLEAPLLPRTLSEIEDLGHGRALACSLPPNSGCYFWRFAQSQCQFQDERTTFISTTSFDPHGELRCNESGWECSPGPGFMWLFSDLLTPLVRCWGRWKVQVKCDIVSKSQHLKALCSQGDTQQNDMRKLSTRHMILTQRLHTLF